MSEDMISEGAPVFENEAELVEAYVDQNPSKDESREDEERILRETFGEPDSDGVYRGDVRNG